ncbi:MAG: hypothetical protein AB7R40_25095 [Nitrospiraceae bacterium]
MLILVSAFAATYFWKAWHFGYSDWVAAVGWGLTIPLMYAIGLLLGRNVDRHVRVEAWRFSAFLTGLSYVSGATLFVFLTVVQRYSVADALAEDYFKLIPSVWSGTLINRTSLGAFASLGMCLIGVLLFWRNIATLKHGSLLVALIALCVALGSYSNIVLANRSPVIAMALSFTVCWCLWVTNAPWTRMLSTAAILTALAFPIYAWWTSVADQIARLYIVGRVLDEGLDTAGRVSSWIAMSSNLFTYTDGGRLADIAGNTYVHNLWLDVAWDAGLMAFCLLIAFHFSHLPSLLRVTVTAKRSSLGIFLVAMSISFFANFMQEPTLAASPLYFSVSCLFLGFTYRLSLPPRRTLAVDSVTPHD